jgi:two-component system CitB family sensor kinase
MHTVVSLIELGRAEQALHFATRRLADTQHLTDLVLGGIAEPALAALVLGKDAEAAERGVDLMVADDVDLPAGVADPRDLVTILGNLLDNAIDAAAGGEPPRWVRIDARVVAGDGSSEEIEIRIEDSGPGLPPEYSRRAFQQGWSTKPRDRLHGRGLGLALVAQAVHRNHGSLETTNDGGAIFTVHLPNPDQVLDAGPAADGSFVRFSANTQ